jgi:hypothetical protein
MRTIKKGLLSLGFVLMISNIVISQEADKKEQPPKERPTIAKLFIDFDKNEDGKLSEKEVKGPLKKDFKRIDQDKDGFLSEQELERAPKPKRRVKPAARN